MQQYFSTVVNVNGSIYVLGGDSKNNDENVIQKFTPGFSDSWEIVYYLPNYQYGYSVCSFLGNICILCGTFNEDERGDSFCIDPVTYESSDLPCLNQPRQFAACTAFRNKIYVFGGKNYINPSNNNIRLRTVEVFDPDLNNWSYTANMVQVRAHHKVIAVKEKIFVFGGSNKFNCEVFDVSNSFFTLLRSPPIKERKRKLYFNVVSVANRVIIYTCNGEEKYIFDTESGNWQITKMKKTSCVLNFSCAIKIPNF